MKVLFAFASIGNFPAYEGVIIRLCEDGHHVTIHYGDTTKKYFNEQSLAGLSSKYGERLSSGPLMFRKRWRRSVELLRKVINRIPYFNPSHPSPWLVDRNTGFGPIAQRILGTRPLVALLKNVSFQRFIKNLERRVPADPKIKSWLCKNPPDVVIGSPCIYSIQNEVEYLRAARELNIPTAIAVFSWDHLLSKGTIHVLPDWLLVWNQNMARDAVALHSISADRIFLTGAPHFDKWFERWATLDYCGFCAKVGLSAKNRYISYMCSAVNRDESGLVAKLADALSSNVLTQNIYLLVRPYPSKSDIWNGFSKKNVLIWPKTGSIPNSSEQKDDYYHAMFHSVAVAGVSTTAFVEAAIIGRPCIALAVEEYQYEHRMGHFKYLLDADFMELANSPSDFVEISKNLILDQDMRAERRGQFARQFARPKGEKRSASEVMANAIEAVAQKGDVTRLCGIDNALGGFNQS